MIEAKQTHCGQYKKYDDFFRPVNGMTACPDIYTEEAFRKTGMLDGGNFGAKTREKITITREFF